MTDAKEWVLANKIKTGLGLVVALASVIVLPLSVRAWAEDLSATQVREAVIAQEAKEEVIHGAMRAKHDLDRANDAVDDAEEDLIYLEEQVVAGTPLTPTQTRKYNKLQVDLVKYEEDAEQAEERLANPENHDENGTESN